MARKAKIRRVISTVIVFGAGMLTAAALASHDANASDSSWHPIIREYVRKKGDALSEDAKIRRALKQAQLSSSCTVEELAVLLAQQDVEVAEYALGLAEEALFNCQNQNP